MTCSEPSRTRTARSLLDALFKADGQTLGALEARLPMTRFGVMKHLRVLEDAGLIVTRRKGREKLHFLNAVPIRLIHDRWVSKYAERWVATLSDLKQRLENTMIKVFEIYIKTTPERLWQAITDTEMRRKYTFGAVVTSDWKVGSHYQGVGHGTRSSRVKILRSIRRAGWCRASGPVGRGRQTRGHLAGDLGDRADRRFMPAGGHHDQLREDTNNQLYGGWPMVLSGLKTLLETGEILTTPGSLRWLQQGSAVGGGECRSAFFKTVRGPRPPPN